MSYNIARQYYEEYNEILDKYHLKCYDGFKLLKASGGKLPIDNLYFV